MTDTFDDNFDDEDFEFLEHQLSASTAMVPVRPTLAPELEKLFNGGNGSTATPILPSGFELRADGIHANIVKKNDDVEDLHVCGPLIVVASARTQDGTNWSKCVRFLNRDGDLREARVSEADLASGGKSVARRLATEGLFVGGAPEAKKQLMLLLNGWNPDRRIVLADRLGWVDDKGSAFILGSGQVIGDMAYEPAFEVPAEHRRASVTMGSLADWQRNVAASCVGNPLMIVAVSLAFVGPLMQPLRVENVGLHLRGASSSGKSTLQRLACSVWGSTDLKRSWNGTRAGVEAIAARYSGTLLVLDELAEVSPADVNGIVYGLGNGTGRARSTSTGGAQSTATWKLPLLSSGEINFAEHMAQAGTKKKDGIEMRFLDIPADTQTYRAFESLHGLADGATFVRAIELAVNSHNGTAGAAFVRKIARMLRGLAGGFVDFEKKFKIKAKTELGLCSSPLDERALTKFALIAYAGEIASLTRVTGWDAGTSMAASIEVFRLWFGNRQVATQAEIDALLDPLRTFVAAHGATGFIDLDGPNVATTIVRFGWQDRDSYFFTRSAFEKACGRHATNEVLEVLDRQGMLKTNNGTGKQFRMPVQVPGRPVAYAVKREVFDVDA